ncbi:Ssl1-like family protein [Theileria parva strain Muguga]|uniref:Ssl1-like family protein n=1 Tax=Theileria parva strain Muguga TaxID=333668 RepID=UPI001C61AFA9|nr:Ssl1-like family protein [Theileria parva strain Muguga]EAN31225.2 Ssl1-like family protein [Theileria parva strain Muguga]
MCGSVNKYVLEELLTEYEQNTEINNNTEDEAYQQYAWELDVDKSWEQLVEKDGVLQFIKPQTRLYQEFDLEYQNNLKQHNLNLIYKRGIIRSIMILFDMSEQMHEMDFKPDRLYCAFNSLKEFLGELYSSGPITQVGIVVMRNKICNVITQFGTNPNEQMELLSSVLKDGPEGSSSLQNGLEMCMKIMCDLPYYSTREILVIFGSNRTLDPGNILLTLDQLKQNFITVNSISLSPELYILKNICKETGGNYSVARDVNHLKLLFNNLTIPPPWKSWMEPILIKVSFPPMKRGTSVSLCCCHNKVVNTVYICPQCHSNSCYIPTKCQGCGIFMVSPPDISRAFHHLIPPKPFHHVEGGMDCVGCNLRVESGYECQDCGGLFCQHCDKYIHQDLHQCPKCLFQH